MRFVSICLLSFTLLLPLPAAADTVIATGADGASGAAGADGAPGAPGGDGEDGESVVAIANTPSEANTASATGGDGGRGGSGGDGVAGAVGGAGGRGGDGGDALAEATTLGHAFVRAFATAGDRGLGGLGGDGSPPGVDGPFGLHGVGGTATANAIVEQAYPTDMPADGLDGAAIANGGPYADGIATISGTATGMGSIENEHSVQAVARSRSGGVWNSTGDALAEATGSTTHGTLSVHSSATVGNRDGAAGATATATSVGTHTGAGELVVGAAVDVFDGFDGQDSGTGVVSASGIATNGADVSVSARLDGGRDSVLRDAVSGSTAGTLVLRQRQGGSVGLQTPPSYGVTRTGLVAGNPGGGDLEIDVMTMALPAHQLRALPDEGDLVFGDIVGEAMGDADVRIEVFGSGREIRQENLDDAAIPSQIFGSSESGDVSVVAEFVGMSVDITRDTGSELIAEPGASIVMDNAVGGETSGNLRLVQDGFAGDGATPDTCSGLGCTGPNPPATSGSGGDVFNRIERSGSYESLSLLAMSRAGRGGEGAPGSLMMDQPAARGGVATTILEATNDAGGVVLDGFSRGGVGGTAYSEPGVGGDASLDFRGETFGDGHSVVIGFPSEQEIVMEGGQFIALFHGVRAGGGGRSFPSQLREPATADGGYAESRSEGVAHGDSEVEVYDHARGGFAGYGGGIGFSTRAGDGSRGGDASSTAIASGGGPSRVIAQSNAFGGQGSRSTVTGGEGGDATSFASATGLGEALASALAEGGAVELLGTTRGSAQALAEATGSAGMASADARTGAGGGHSFRAAITRATTTSTRVEATATYAAAIPQTLSGRAGTAFLTGDPTAGDVDLATDSHAELSDVLAGTPGSRIEGIGQWSALSDAGTSSTQLVELDITLRTPESGGGEVGLAIFDLGSANGGFESLAFRLEVLGEDFGPEMVFDDLAEASAYFSSLILLGAAFGEYQTGDLGSHAIRAYFEVVTAGQQEARFGLAAVVVPEPSTALLLGIGLAVIAARRRRR